MLLVQAPVVYACALCSYKMQEMGPALQYISAILDHSHPISGALDQATHIRDASIIEALNLKFAIEFRMKNKETAATALEQLPHRDISALDPVQEATRKLPMGISVGDTTQLCNCGLGTDTKRQHF